MSDPVMTNDGRYVTVEWDDGPAAVWASLDGGRWYDHGTVDRRIVLRTPRRGEQLHIRWERPADVHWWHWSVYGPPRRMQSLRTGLRFLWDAVSP